MIGAGVAVVSGLIAFAIYSEAAQGHELDVRVSRLTQQNVALRQQITDRQREIIEAQTAAWLEEQARKLGYVFPGEKIFVIAPPGSVAPASGGVNAPLPSFSPIPSPTPSAPASPSPNPTPTPVGLIVPTPTPHR